MSRRQISHYQLEALIGQGGMGSVYRATDLILERPVAIKLISAHAKTDASFLERFRREARLAAQLNHPHIATIYEFGEDEDDAFLVMEFVDGMTLRQLLDNGPLSFEMASKCGEQTAAALAVAHAQGIVHRDIKCENLMLTGQGSLKVMDFGVARRAGETQLTIAGQLLGTPKTMAPETIKGAEPGPPADLFALGCVLYEVISGQAPFLGEDVMSLLFQITSEEPTPLKELRPETPVPLLEIIAALLNKNPEKRCGPAQAVSVSLSQGVMRPSSLTMSNDETLATDMPTTTQSKSSHSKVVRLAFIMGGIIVAALIIIWMRSSHETVTERHARAVQLNDKAFRLPADSTQVAIQLLEEATRIDPNYSVPWNNLGDLARTSSDFAQAETFFRQALKVDPKSGHARLNLADTLEKLERTGESIAEYRRVILENSTVAPIAANNLGHLLLLQGQYVESMAVLQDAVARWPSIAALWKNLGLSLLSSGSVAEAADAFDHAVEIQPDNTAARDGILVTSAITGKPDSLQRWTERTVSNNNPIDPGVKRALQASNTQLQSP